MVGLDHEANRKTLLGLGISPEVVDYIIAQGPTKTPPSPQGWSLDGQTIPDNTPPRRPPPAWQGPPERGFSTGGPSSPITNNITVPGEAPQVQDSSVKAYLKKLLGVTDDRFPAGSDKYFGRESAPSPPWQGPEGPREELGDQGPPMPEGPGAAPTEEPEMDPMVAKYMQRNLGIPTRLGDTEGAAPFRGGRQPYEDKAASQKSDDRARLMDLFAGLKEAGNKFSNIQTSGEIMLGLPKGEPQVAQGFRQRAAEERDRVSPATRDFLKSVLPDVEIPEGVKQSELNKMLPMLTRMAGGGMDGGGMIGYRRDRLDFEKQRHGELLAQSKVSEARRTRDTEVRIQNALRGVGEKFRGSAQFKSNMESINASHKAMSMLEEGTQASQVAAVVSIARASGEKGPLSDSDVDRWSIRKDALGKAEAYLKRLGTGRLLDVHVEELKGILERYLEQAADAIEAEANMRAKSESFIEGGKRSAEAIKENLLLPGGVPRVTASAGDKKWVPMINPDTGKTEEVHPEDVLEAESKGWKRS